MPDEASAPFFAGARARRADAAALRRLRDVQSPTAYLGVPVRPRCVALLLRRRWSGRPSSGRATLYSFARRCTSCYDQAFAAELPYNIAVVETEEGVRLTSQVVDCPTTLEIGMPLEVTFERLSDEVAIPKFRPRG